jgi:hypothetical protein
MDARPGLAGVSRRTFPRDTRDRRRGLAPDPHGIITSGHGKSTGRTISYYQGDIVPDGPPLDILRAVIAGNRTGGWRRIKADAEGNR